MLVYAHLPSSPEQETVRSFLLTALRRKHTTFVITALVLHEFIHVVTDARRFQPPVPMAQAIALAQQYLGRSNIEYAVVDELALGLALDSPDSLRLGRKRIADTLLAATLLSRGVDHATLRTIRSSRVCRSWTRGSQGPETERGGSTAGC